MMSEEILKQNLIHLLNFLPLWTYRHCTITLFECDDQYIKQAPLLDGRP